MREWSGSNALQRGFCFLCQSGFGSAGGELLEEVMRFGGGDVLENFHGANLP